MQSSRDSSRRSPSWNKNLAPSQASWRSMRPGLSRSRKLLQTTKKGPIGLSRHFRMTSVSTSNQSLASRTESRRSQRSALKLSSRSSSSNGSGTKKSKGCKKSTQDSTRGQTKTGKISSLRSKGSRLNLKTGTSLIFQTKLRSRCGLKTSSRIVSTFSKRRSVALKCKSCNPSKLRATSATRTRL